MYNNSVVLKEVFKKLDNWILKENHSAIEESARQISNCEFKLLGQTALIEAKIDLSLAQTADVDAYTDAAHVVTEKLNKLLSVEGLHLDNLGKEIWMPEETKYQVYFIGKFIKVFLAEPDYIIFSKALKAPVKNKALVTEYLAKEPSDLFFKMAEKYKLNFEEFLQP